MKNLSKFVALAGLAAIMSGCTVTQSAQYAVARYCHLPDSVRAANREVVAYAVTPHRISIECAGGPRVRDQP